MSDIYGMVRREREMYHDKKWWACVWKRAAKENRAFYQLTLGTAKSNQLKWHEAEAEATRLRGLLSRANMALLVYTQSHGTPHTQLMDEIADALGLDANGNTKVLVEEFLNE